MTNELEIIKRAQLEILSTGRITPAREALAAVERLEAERQSDTERLKDVRQRVYDIGYALSCSPSEIDKRACGECVGVVELIDATVKP